MHMAYKLTVFVTENNFYRMLHTIVQRKDSRSLTMEILGIKFLIIDLRQCINFCNSVSDAAGKNAGDWAPN